MIKKKELEEQMKLIAKRSKPLINIINQCDKWLEDNKLVVLNVEVMRQTAIEALYNPDKEITWWVYNPWLENKTTEKGHTAE